MKKSYIWTLPTRVFHILFVLFILLAFLSEDDRLINYHAIVGYTILPLLIFRFFWGFFGPKYSSFRDFPTNILEAKEFIKNIFKPKKYYIGHNPLASYVMIFILFTVFLIIISGILTLGIQEGKGILSFLNIEYFQNMKFFKKTHEYLANFLLLLIFFHISGVVFDTILHSKNQTALSIITGYKITEKKENIALNIFQNIFAFCIFIFLAIFLVYTLFKPSNILTASIYKPVDYKVQNITFVNECASCHTLYPPNLLPKKSWELLMSDLENHFGDDASIDQELNKSILDFLQKNSAENFTIEASWNFLNSIKNQDIITLTKTSYWEKRHKNIPKKVFETSRVRSVANCKACHSDIEKGLIEDENIADISSFM